jgi:methionyl-tRNA formyltransferase
VYQALNILFAGTPAFSVPALDALVRSRHHVVGVYTQPDRPAGRGRQLGTSPVKDFALLHRIPVEQPLTLREPSAQARLREFHADVMVVVAYGLILPPEVLATPRFGCLNIHASLLPRWRGAAPIQRALLAGDEQTGVDIMQMEAGLDTGPVLVERAIAIGPRDTAGSLHDRLALLGAEALLEALEAMVAGAIEPRAQAASGATYARKILKPEATIDWSRPAIEIDRQVRAFNPVPIAETTWKGTQLRILEAEPVAIDPGRPGTVVAADAEGIVVATGAGGLKVRRLQLAGRNAMGVADFLHAHRIVGDVLGQPAAVGEERK